MAQTVGSNEDALLQALAEALLRVEDPDRTDSKTIRSSSDVLGGEARIRDTRIPVWLLVAHKKWGESDAEILAQYPSLNAVDLTAAWDYYTVNTERVDAERRANEDAA